MDSMKNLGIEKLKEYLKENGLKQGVFADISGISQGAISHYLTGRRKKVDPVNAQKIISVVPSIRLEDFYAFLEDNAA